MCQHDFLTALAHKLAGGPSAKRAKRAFLSLTPLSAAILR